MKEEMRIPAGINWAKTTITPPVKKKQIPKSPTPLIPPAQAIPREADAIAKTNIKLKNIKIFLIFANIIYPNPYFFTGAGSTPGSIAFSSAAPFSGAFFFASKPVVVPIKEKNRMIAGIS